SRYGGCQHEGMPTSPLCPDMVRPLTDNGIRYGIENQRNQDCGGYQVRANAYDLIIIKQQERAERYIFDAIANGTHAVEHFCDEAELGSSFRYYHEPPSLCAK